MKESVVHAHRRVHKLKFTAATLDKSNTALNFLLLTGRRSYEVSSPLLKNYLSFLSEEIIMIRGRTVEQPRELLPEADSEGGRLRSRFGTFVEDT